MLLSLVVLLEFHTSLVLVEQIQFVSCNKRLQVVGFLMQRHAKWNILRRPVDLLVRNERVRWLLLVMVVRWAAQLDAQIVVVAVVEVSVLVLVVVYVEVVMFAFNQFGAMIMRPIDVRWMGAGLRKVNKRPLLLVHRLSVVIVVQVQ